MQFRIVVGMDGSDGSRRALRWALDEAATRGALLQAVQAWQIPLNFEEIALLGGDDDWTGAAASELAEAVAAVLRDVDTTMHVEQRVLEGAAASTLCALSSDADLLVVGAGPHGFLAGLRLGSVSIHCAHHSHSPVVIIP